MPGFEISVAQSEIPRTIDYYWIITAYQYIGFRDREAEHILASTTLSLFVFGLVVRFK